jgi:hypothetical protein
MDDESQGAATHSLWVEYYFERREPTFNPSWLYDFIHIIGMYLFTAKTGRRTLEGFRVRVILGILLTSIQPPALGRQEVINIKTCIHNDLRIFLADIQ